MDLSETTHLIGRVVDDVELVTDRHFSFRYEHRMLQLYTGMLLLINLCQENCIVLIVVHQSDIIQLRKIEH